MGTELTKVTFPDTNYIDLKHYTPYKGNLTDLGSGTPAAATKTYWEDNNNIPIKSVSTAYNNSGSEFALLFSKGADNKYGTVLKYGYENPYFYILRRKNGSWLDSDWIKMNAGYADTAGAVSATNITSGYLNTQPENNPILIPFIHNDIAFLIQKGGSVIIKYDGTTQSINIDSCFDGAPGYGYAISNVNNYTEITIELTLFKTFSWTNTIYVDFGSVSWRAKDVKIEVINTNYTSDVWTEKYHSTNNGAGHCFIACSHTPVGASNAGGGFNKIRYTFKTFNHNTIFRIAQLGLYNYSSNGLRETYMSKGIDDSVYRNITPSSNNTYNLGSSSYRWNTIYATTFSGTATALNNFQVSTSSNLGLEISTNSVGYVSGLTKADWNYQQVDGAIYGQAYSDKWKHEIFADYKTGQLSVRGKNNGTWQSWRKVWDSVNLTSKTAAASGTDLSLVTTGEKATWNAKASTDTKNTAGSTDTSSKIFLIGATSQAANPQTYSDNEVYATNGVLTTKSVQVGGGSATMEYDTTTQSINFIFN